jgi:hypothetical protein
MKENGKLTVSAASEVPPFPPFPRLHGSCRVNTVPQPKPSLCRQRLIVLEGFLNPGQRKITGESSQKKGRLIFAQIIDVHFPGYKLWTMGLWV